MKINYERRLALARLLSLVDEKWYMSKYQDVAMLEMDVTQHFVEIGAFLNRLPQEHFDVEEYLNCIDSEYHDEIREILYPAQTKSSRQNPEYLTQKLPGSQCTDFDEIAYLANNPDVARAGLDPFSHYVNSGEQEGRWPNEYFDPTYYMANNSDVRSSGISGFLHFRDHGYAEGRLSRSPLISSKRIQTINSILFVGHDGIQAGSEVVLLELVKWYYNNTNRRLKVLLLSCGPLADRYAAFSDVYTLPEYKIDNPDFLRNFLDEDFEFIYLNTVVAGRFFPLMRQISVSIYGPYVTHIHEMAKVLAIFDAEMTELISNTTMWISASPSTTKVLTKEYNIDEDKIKTVPAFIAPLKAADTSDIECRKRARKIIGIADDDFVVAGCGTVYWRKGPDLFVETARSVFQTSKTKPVFLWIGGGSDVSNVFGGLSEEEKTYIWYLGPRSDANELLACADVFYLASREDPFPLVVLEAAQYAVPTVCFGPATGITKFIKTDAGVILDDVDPLLAAETILSLAADEQLLNAYGNVAKYRLYDKYTAEIGCKKIFLSVLDFLDYKPSVSVIVPFFNHEKFVLDRMSSILNQSMQDFEVILIDDASSDQTPKFLELYQSDPRVSLHVNKKNTGSPFKQWQKGISKARAEIIWIAEGDDSCSSNFLKDLSCYFNDPMMGIASAQTEAIDADGKLMPEALSDYLTDARPGKFTSSYVNDGFKEVEECMAASCTLVNASGLLLRKSLLSDEVLEHAGRYKMCSDWLVYLSILRNSKIAYDITVTNYSRRHKNFPVAKIEGSSEYFAERKGVSEYVINNFPVNKKVVKKMKQHLLNDWNRFSSAAKDSQFLLTRALDEAARRAPPASTKGTVAFYVHGMLFSKGGIERVAAGLGNFLSQHHWNVIIYCRISSNTRAVFPVFESVDVRGLFDELDLERSVNRLRADLLNSEVDVFVPMLSEWLFEPVVSAVNNTGIHLVVSEHNNPWKIEERWWSKPGRRVTFNKADKIHLLLESYRCSLPLDMQDKIVVIPNGVHTRPRTERKGNDKRILSIGRLVEQKRFDRLIGASRLIREQLISSGYRVEIYGDGESRQELQDQIVQGDLGDVVFLTGLTDDMSAIMENSSFYVQTSEFEGLSVAVLEALAHGLPVIGYEECTGMSELVKNNENGFLIQDPLDIDELAGRIACLIEDEDCRNRFSLCSEVISQKYAITDCHESWEHILDSIVHGGGATKFGFDESAAIDTKTGVF